MLNINITIKEIEPGHVDLVMAGSNEGDFTSAEADYGDAVAEAVKAAKPNYGELVPGQDIRVRQGK